MILWDSFDPETLAGPQRWFKRVLGIYQLGSLECLHIKGIKKKIDRSKPNLLQRYQNFKQFTFLGSWSALWAVLPFRQKHISVM